MSATLPDFCYHNSDIFDAECERIFRRHWWLIGPESRLAGAGDFFAFRLLRWPLVVVRDQQQQLRGFYNLCRHRAGPLVLDGRGQCREFVCRYHGWRYACSGELLKTPGIETGSMAGTENLGLLPIRVDCWNGLVFICLDADAPDLADWLGDVVSIAADYDAIDAMQFDGEVAKTARTNWKTYGDNSCEGYHVGMVHRDLGSSMLRDSVSVAGYDNGGFVGFDVRYGDGRDLSRAGKGFWIYKFPGLLLHFADYAFNAESVFPQSPKQIELRRWFWSDHAKAARHGVDPATICPNSEQVIDEDLAICELVQRNLESGVYPGGHLAVAEEPGTVYFQQQVRAVLGDLLQAEAPHA